MQYLKELFLNISIRHIIDMAIVALVFYKVFLLIRETRAEQIVKGIVLLLLATKISQWLKLYTVLWILEKTMTVGVIALLIVFQPELRRALEYLGRSRFFTRSFVEIKDEDMNNLIEEIIEAVASLSRQKIGALIVFEQETGLNEIVETGTKIGGDISTGLLINIFIPNTPLHDGAVVVRKNIIKAASCFLPLTDNANLSKDLGTRHRAALGVTEKSDALVVVVSEETGSISVAENGKLSRYLDISTLRQTLVDVYKPEKQKQSILSKWRGKNEEKE
ncbi:diadenylate cyclase CdaA [Dethiothermospora halolimnae]|uniref:diadenylate cyclase CdaA n=1 Tax=Dethiothermospora halolimnae TaxID=3114390 RepID=UPI003CCC3706